MNDIAISFRAGHSAAIQSFAKVCGLVSGTAIMTMTGPIDAADIKAGAKLIARSGLRTVRAATHINVPVLRMVEVPANAIAAGIPEQTILLAPETLVTLPPSGKPLQVDVDGREHFIRPKPATIRASDLAQAGYPVRFRSRANVTLTDITLDEACTVYASTLQICIGHTE